VSRRKGLKLSYAAQDTQFPPSLTVRAVIQEAADPSRTGGDDEAERKRLQILGSAGFKDLDIEVEQLSGGWRKRLAIVQALVSDPDLLLLDEPTNHLDLAGIHWLETLLQSASFACVLVSHDRYFLESVATSTAELHRVYPGGLLRVDANYSEFLSEKSAFLAAQAKHQKVLENRVRVELEWLRRGPKARATKAKARIDAAHEIICELTDLNARTRVSTADIDFTFSDRKTKRLVEARSITYSFAERTLFDHLDFTLTPGLRVGLVGPNGSGKTTLLRLIRGDLQPKFGKFIRAEALKIVYFDQNRPLDPDVTLRRALAPQGDSVVYQDRSIHVASWAARFLFSNEQLNQPVRRLSGGERARLRIAGLMLEPADVLLLDEPTNDLDIPTLEVLEESLLEFRGALVLVTHDRFMLDRVSTLVIGLDGEGDAGVFAGYAQWESWQAERAKLKPKARDQKFAVVSPRSSQKKKLSYLESREFESIERCIVDAESVLAAKRRLLEDPKVVQDPKLLNQAYEEMREAEAAVNALYDRWAELDAKLAG
jgi:ATP-binding cassette subfamily F protein uup